MGLVAKAVSQPLWAALVDGRVFGRVDARLGPVSNHIATVASTLVSLVSPPPLCL